MYDCHCLVLSDVGLAYIYASNMAGLEFRCISKLGIGGASNSEEA